MWYKGTGITGTSTTAAIYSGSGVTNSRVNDLYLNTSTGNVYQCTTAGAASVAKWIYIGCIKGPAGAQGAKGDTGATGAKGDKGDTGAQGAAGTPGSMWYNGTGITGNSTTATVFSNSGVSNARVNDMFINTSTGYVYKCTTAGAASVAKWIYIGNIKGAAGAQGPKGDKGDKGDPGDKLKFGKSYDQASEVRLFLKQLVEA